MQHLTCTASAAQLVCGPSAIAQHLLRLTGGTAPTQTILKKSAPVDLTVGLDRLVGAAELNLPMSQGY